MTALEAEQKLVLAASGHDYITPEALQERINKGADINVLRCLVLGAVGRQLGIGLEDLSLCCYVVYMGEPDEEEQNGE